MADHVAGLYASLALLGALEFRHRTGKGQFIDLSQTETMSSLLSDGIIDYTLKGKAAKPEGNSSLQSAPHGVYRCSGQDRWCAITVTSNIEWEGFKRALNYPAWASEERFSALSDRLRSRADLDNLIQGWTQNHSAEEVMSLLQKEGVPAGIVQNAAGVANDSQLRSRGFFQELEHPDLEKSFSDANPIRLSDNTAQYRQAAPTSGQDNDYVYKKLLNLSEEEIKKLKQDNII